MSFSVPITTDDLDTLPDNTTLIENLAANDKITTVVPRFLGTEDTGRFVTAFFTFHGTNGTNVTLYTRTHNTDSESSLEKQTTINLTNEPIILGDLWNQTILIEAPDIESIEHLKQRAEYDTYWLSLGHDPGLSFNEYKREPFPSTPTGLPDCDHTKAEDPVKTPNLDMTVTMCDDCGIPLAVATDNGGLEAHNTISAEFAGIPVDDDHPVRSTTTTPTGPLTNAEITLHVLSRYANVEQSHFDIYARNDRHGYLITLGSAVAGYALWNTFDDYPALQQIYIFPEFRGSHLGEILVRSWFDQLDAEHYYAIGPNDAGTATLSSLGHFDDDCATPATILSCSDTLDAGAVNASYTDRVRRGKDPLQS
jgi:hypothetical protein